MEEDQEQLNQKLETNEVPEENAENVINTEENIISNTPPSTTPISAKITVTPNQITAPKNNNTEAHSLWYDLSIISWFLFLCTGLNIFINNNNTINITFTQTPTPLYSNYSFVIGFISIIGTIGFILYFNKTTLKKNNTISNGLLGDMTKFHFVSLFLVSFVFISLAEPSTKASDVFCLIFSLLAYGSLIYMYFKIDYEGEWYEIITIKKGVFSSLIALTLYTFCLSISSIGARSNASEGFLKGCGIVFSILIGIGNCGFAFYFKDLLALITNILIYLEMAKYCFYFDKNADGVIDIIMILISVGVIFYLQFKEREYLYKCSN